jgi:hypothetical protein
MFGDRSIFCRCISDAIASDSPEGAGFAVGFWRFGTPFFHGPDWVGAFDHGDEPLDWLPRPRLLPPSPPPNPDEFDQFVAMP